MNIAIRWTLLAAALAAGYLALRLRQERRNDRTAFKADLDVWENEGGNVAQPPRLPSPMESTRLA